MNVYPIRRHQWACVSLTGLLVMAPFAAAAAPTDLQKLLRQIEARYNRAVTLQLAFSEIYTGQGRPHTPEHGELFLRKPGRMRWQYTKPAGKLFVSDGKDVYYYNADMNRVERMRVKDAEDMRAPLAFLIGRLDFNRDFRQYQTSPEGDKIWVTCIPKSEKLPFTEVRFLTSPSTARIEHVRVVGQDKSVIDFDFSDEVINPPLADKMFQFQIPAGAQYIDSSASKGER